MKYFEIIDIEELHISKKHDSLNFFYSSSSNFLKYLSCSLSSLLDKCQKFLLKKENDKFKDFDINIIIFNDGEVPSGDKSKIANYFGKKFSKINFNIYFIILGNYYFKDKIPEERGLSFHTYYRLFIFHKVFANLKYCMFIDCDTIIYREDFIDQFIKYCNILFDSKKKIAVVQDLEIINSCTHSTPLRSSEFDKKIQIFFENRIGISLQDYINKYLKISIKDYLNAGIIIFNHFSNNTEYFNELIKVSSETLYPFVDQCVINKVIGKDKIFLPLHWNRFPITNFCEFKNNIFFENNSIYSSTDIEDSFNNPIIIHYAGLEKPWSKDWKLGHKNKLFKIFNYYTNISPYKLDIKKEIFFSAMKILARESILFTIRIFIKSYGK